MNHSLSSPAHRPFVALLAFAALALGACSERPTPTQPVPQSPSRIITCGDDCGGGGGGGGDVPPPPPTITSLSLPNSTLAIDGVSVTYNATITNDGPSLSGVVAQGYIMQGSAVRAAGGTQVNCGAGTGVLPSGTCQISFIAVAGNNLAGSGTLVQGGATFGLNVTSSSFTTSRTVGVILIPGALTASGVNTLNLSGVPGALFVSMQGGSQTVSGLSFQMEVIQGQIHRFAGSGPLQCFGGVAGQGNLPPKFECPTLLSPSVTTGVGGPDILNPGRATLQVSVFQGTTLLNTKGWPITLIETRILSIIPSPNPMRIGGGSQLFTAGVYTSSEAMRNVLARAYVRQSSGARSWSTEAPINCGYGPGYLTGGSCTFIGSYAADTSRPYVNLVPGPATLTLELRGQDPSSFLITVADVPITLVSLPTISTVTATGSATINVFGSLAGYTAVINNPGPPISNATMMVRIIQGDLIKAARQGIPGPVTVNCVNTSGTLPTGTCTFNGFYSASNTAPGTGTLVPGPATLEIELSDPANGTMSTKFVPITLVGS